MADLKSKNIINCSDLSSDQINYEVKNLLFNNIKNIILKDVNNKKNLLNDLKGNIKIEIIGNPCSYFADELDGPKVIVNGDISNYSACNMIGGKITVFGSCGNDFAGDVKSGEFYILENCGSNSFSNLNENCKVVIGGCPGNIFACGNKGGVIVVLNLKGGKMFIDDNSRWLERAKNVSVFLRGDCKSLTDKILLENTKDSDEDIYLPLISEFARLFKYSLSEIKSKPFYRINLK